MRSGATMNTQVATIDQIQLGEVASLTQGNRTEVKDYWLKDDINEAKLRNGLFVRLVGKKKKITNVDFTYSIFESCYFRKCFFDSCNFTGCRFVGSNLTGSSFIGCTFDYATFERTFVSDDVLKTSCPGFENLKLKFARSLRTNFQQIGDVKAANLAIRIELEATEIHLRKAWKSNESYYRKKYAGIDRLKVLFEWLHFKALDFVWGNGESALKLTRTILVAFGIMTLVDVLKFKDPLSLVSYGRSLLEMPQIFLGSLTPAHYSRGYLACITFVRLVGLAFFMSIIIKRFNRR
jgi:hypothetical protein